MLTDYLKKLHEEIKSLLLNNMYKLKSLTKKAA